jgi:hypothetical protein
MPPTWPATTLLTQFKFQIPAGYTIPPHGFLLVWADGKPTNGTPDLHLNFKLSKTGESIGLFGGDRNVVDYVIYGAQAEDVSEGRYPDGAAARFFMPTPTPRTNNLIPNTPPVLAEISNRWIYAGQTLSLAVSASDAECPSQSLSFTLDPAAPAGACISPATGVFSWAATNVPVQASNTITIRVSDDGVPALSATASFVITVMSPPQLGAAKPIGSMLPFVFSTLPGQTYQIQFKDNLEDASWSALTSPLPGTGGLLEVDEDLTGQAQRFYRLVVLP